MTPWSMHFATYLGKPTIEPCTANERRASNGSPDFQAPAGITRSLAMQASIRPLRHPLEAPKGLGLPGYLSDTRPVQEPPLNEALI